MKPVKENLISNIAHSFRIKHSVLDHFDSPWHFHPDFELFYIIRGYGKQYVGDSVDEFQEGDLIFLGPNLPHVWHNETSFVNDPDKQAEAIVIQFKENTFGESFFDLPEFSAIRKFLNLSKRGFRINGDTKKRITELMLKIVNLQGAKRIIVLLEILDILANSEEVSIIAGPVFEKFYFNENDKSISRVFEYISNNFNKDITLEKIAKVANMTKTAFCRYFKKKTLKTVFEYIEEVRLGYAVNLLQSTSLSVQEISSKSGYENPSYFNKIFKKNFALTPKEYRNNIVNKIQNKGTL